MQIYAFNLSFKLKCNDYYYYINLSITHPLFLYLYGYNVILLNK